MAKFRWWQWLRRWYWKRFLELNFSSFACWDQSVVGWAAQYIVNEGAWIHMIFKCGVNYSHHHSCGALINCRPTGYKIRFPKNHAYPKVRIFPHDGSRKHHGAMKRNRSGQRHDPTQRTTGTWQAIDFSLPLIYSIFPPLFYLFFKFSPTDDIEIFLLSFYFSIQDCDGKTRSSTEQANWLGCPIFLCQELI